MQKIDWTKWSAIAEILSAMAILITLLYLAAQTRYVATQIAQNTQAMRATASQVYSQQEADYLRTLLDYPGIIPSYDKPEITIEEAARLYAHLTAFARSRESLYHQYRLGVIDEATYRQAENPFVYTIRSERLHNWWLNERQTYDSDFVERIDTQLAASKGDPVIVGESFLRNVFQRPN